MVPCSLTTHVKIWRWASVVFMPRSLYPSPRQRPVTKGTACPSSQARGFPRNHCVPSFFKPLWLCGTKLWLPWFFPEICPHLQDVCITRLPEPAREALRLGRHSPSGTWSAETRAALLTVDQEAGWRRRLSAQDASRRPWKVARLSVHASLTNSKAEKPGSWALWTAPESLFHTEGRVFVLAEWSRKDISWEASVVTWECVPDGPAAVLTGAPLKFRATLDFGHPPFLLSHVSPRQTLWLYEACWNERSLVLKSKQMN